MPQVGDVGTGVWEGLLRSVGSHRHRDARHLKPICLHVVSVGLDRGELDPDDIDPSYVVEGVASILLAAGLPLPTRLWRPLWHLTNDGAWSFMGPAGRVGPDDFGPGRKPESLSAIGAKVDRIEVRDPLREYWLSSADRSTLRALVFEMLEGGDANSQAVARVLPGDEQADTSTKAMRSIVSGSQGRTSDVAVRLAVERHAMARVIAHYRSEGWCVTDVSATHSHDLLCTRAGESLLVEVKGTTGLGRKVQLTANEVALARSGAEAALAIVAEIDLIRDGAAVYAEGGALRILAPWAPDASDLRVVAYQYTVPSA